MQFFGSRRDPQTSDEAAEEQFRPMLTTSAEPHTFETVLGPSTVIQGSLACSGNIRLDGRFKGTLKIEGNVLVGETAHIQADLNAHNISVAGEVEGNLSGKKIQLLRTARVTGDIQAEALTMAEGAVIEGKVSMTSPGIQAEVIHAVESPVKVTREIEIPPMPIESPIESMEEDENDD
ncbi:MAG: hypothetical protein OHK0046_49930 [Anaerolineae bacterium]